MLSLYDEGRELDKGEILRLKMNMKLGFTGKKDGGATLKLG